MNSAFINKSLVKLLSQKFLVRKKSSVISCVISSFRKNFKNVSNFPD